MGSTSSTTTWRPPQWGGQPAVYSIQTSGTAVNSSGDTGTIAYVFDAVLVASHRQEVVVTKYPVQTGASIAYHSYIQPAQVVLEIGMSDAMDAFTAGVWEGAATKSASAFQVLSTLKNSRQPLTLATRLFTYNNMVITSITAEETSKTVSSLRARITFEEIFVANDSSTAGTGGTSTTSARDQDTQYTPQGVTTGQAVDTTTSTQYGVPSCYLASSSSSDYICTGSNIGSYGADDSSTAIGTGHASSVPTSNLPATSGGS
jgi:hypothetical protein